MAEEKKILVDIEINSEDIKKANESMASSAKSAALLTLELNKLKEEQKANSQAAKDGTISANELAARQAGLKLKMTETSKALAASNKEYANNKTVIDAAKGSNEQLRARLSILTKEYNGLSKEQRESTSEGQKMEATIKTITDKLKANEKAVGDNRRNVGNYKDQIKEAAIASGSFGKGLVGMASGLKSATVASLKFLATPLGMVIGAIGLAIGLVVGGFKLMTASLNRTEDGAAALAGVMNVFKGVMSGILTVIEPIALFLVEGLANGFEKLGKMVETSSKQIEKGLRFLGLDNAANGLAKVTTAVKETSIATAQLAKAEAELNKIKREQGILQLESQNRAEKLRQIRDDESKSLKERIKANKDLGAELTKQSDAELKLANRALEIANLRIKADGASSENLDKQAEAQLKIAEIEERITSQRSEQMTNENSLIRDGISLAKEANKLKIANLKKEKDLSEKAAKALIKRWQDEREMIDDLAEIKKNDVIASIENAEERAEKIAFIEREALLQKIANIDEETIEATAGADAIGAVDEEKYAKQLVQRAAFQAKIVEMDRAERAQEFTDKIAALSIDEKLELDAAELSIDNAKELEKEKAKIGLKFLKTKLELTTALAKADGDLTDEEIKNLQLIKNAIDKITKDIGSEVPTLADMMGLSDDDLGKIQEGLALVGETLATIQMAVSAGAENRINEIDAQANAEILAIEKSTLSEEKKDAKIKAINKKAAQERYKIELQQFKTAKALSIVMAIVNTATAVMAQLSNPVPFTGFVLAALAAVTGAVQIGVISSQQPPAAPQFARGGILQGASHADGGIQMYGNGQHYGEAEGGEIVLTKGVNANPKLRAEASRLNVLGGGVPLAASGYMANGGIVSPTFAARQTATSSSMTKGDFADVISEMPAPVVQVTEINRVQGRVATVSESANL